MRLRVDDRLNPVSRQQEETRISVNQINKKLSKQPNLHEANGPETGEHKRTQQTSIRQVVKRGPLNRAGVNVI